MIFFFSSRRRHTRWPRDWSSDVCSSDLRVAVPHDLVGGAGVADGVVDHRLLDLEELRLVVVQETRIPVQADLGAGDQGAEVPLGREAALLAAHGRGDLAQLGAGGAGAAGRPLFAGRVDQGAEVTGGPRVLLGGGGDPLLRPPLVT